MIPISTQKRRLLMALATLVGLVILLYIGPKLVEADGEFVDLEVKGICADPKANVHIWQVENPNVNELYQ